MDKQIIIDGCDVSGCENYGETMVKTHNCTLYDEYLRPCKGANCYYKQLKRKEQECEELKDKLLKLLGKEGLRQSEKEFYEQQLDQLKADNKHLNDLLNQALKELEQSREAIEKIKEIAEEYQKEYIVNNGVFLLCNQILQICDEVNE